MTDPLDDAQVAEWARLAVEAKKPWHPWGDESLPERSGESAWAEDVDGYLGGEWGKFCAALNPWAFTALLADRAALAARLAEVEGEVALLEQQVESWMEEHDRERRRVAGLKEWRDKEIARAAHAEAAVARVAGLVADALLSADDAETHYEDGYIDAMEHIRAALRGEAGEGTGDAGRGLSRTQGERVDEGTT